MVSGIAMDLIQRDLRVFCVFAFLLCCGLVASDNAAPAVLEPELRPVDVNQTTEETHGILEGTHQLGGFQPYATIPISFPIDICMMLIQDYLYAACLHLDYYHNKNATSLTIFRRAADNDSSQFVQIYTIHTESARYMDCNSLGTNGYVAVVNHIDDNDRLRDASPVYQITNDTVTVVQFFAQRQQNHVRLSKFGNNMYLVQTFFNDSTNATSQMCPIYKWNGLAFDLLSGLPCSNAMHAEPFIIHSNVFVAVANYRDADGSLQTDSYLYKLNMATLRFELLQTFRTNGAQYAKYVHIVHHGRSQHFLMIANAGAKTNKGDSSAIVYKYIDGHMMAHQEIVFETAVRQLLPVLGSKNEFVLLAVQDNMEVKSFQYDGRSFVASDIQFTGGSFGRGVAALRTFKLNGEDLIVVANEEMFRDSTNLFIPKYRYEKAHVKFPSDFDEWHGTKMSHLRNNDLADLVEKLETISAFLDKMSMRNDLFNGLVMLENSTIAMLNSHMLRTETISVSAAEWSDYIKMANEIIAKYEQPAAGDQQLVGSEHDQPLSSLPSLPTHQRYETVKILENIDVKLINDRPAFAYNFNNSNWILQSLWVNDLIIRNDPLTYGQLYAKLSTAEELVRASRNVNQPKSVDEITLNGTLNGYRIEDLVQNTLKVNEAEQMFDGPVIFNSLSVSDFTAHATISGLDPNNIIRTDAGVYWIDQDIRFTESLAVNNLIFKERLNHVSVLHGVPDVIFTQTRTLQLIPTEVTFDSLILVEPIGLSGRIHSKSLEQMKPIKSIDQHIELVGDFRITGNVSAKRLSATDLTLEGGAFSVGRLHRDGIALTQSLIHVPIHFAREITVANLGGDALVNNLKMSSLVRSNTMETQEIIGEKVFLDDLQVRNGACDATVVNGIDLVQLNQTIVKRTGRDQTITGTFRLKQIVVDAIEYQSLEVGGRSVNDLITIDSPQTINGVVSVGSSLIASGDQLSVNHLVAHHNVFGTNLSAILAHAVYRADRQHIRGRKHFHSVTIDRALFVNNDFWGIGPTKRVLDVLASHNNEMVIGSSSVFHRDFFIDELIFTDYLNNISSKDFGHQWLLYESDQTFTAPAAISQLVLDDKLTLNGWLNGIDIDQLVTNTLMKDTTETVIVRNIIFENLLIQKNVLLNGQYSGLRIPQDILLRRSQHEQLFNGSVRFDNSITATGNVFVEYLNGFHSDVLCDLALAPLTGSGLYGLEILGLASFNTEPIIGTLNGQIFHDHLANTWFTTDSIISLSTHVILEQIEFMYGITINGTLNGHTIQEIVQNYFSVSRPQVIQSFVTVRGNIVLAGGADIKHLLLEGNLHTGSGQKIKIDDFASFSLQKGGTNELINAPWTLDEVIIEGEIGAAIINGLSLIDDVVRYSANNTITGPKTFENLHIEKLKCGHRCSLNTIRMGEWMKNTASTIFSHTIQGTTTLINPTIATDVTVRTVNGQTVTTRTILLRSIDQSVHGNVFIEAASSTVNQILPITFENVQAQFINNVHFSSFIQNLVRKDKHDQSSIALQSNIRFQRPLTVGHLKLHGQVYDAHTSQLPSGYRHTSNAVQHNARNMDSMVAIQQQLRSRLHNNNGKHFSELIERQRFGSDVRKLMPVHFGAHSLVAMLSTWHGQDMIHFVVWHNDQQQLVPAEGLMTIEPPNMRIIDMFRFRVGEHDCIVVLTQQPESVLFAHSFFMILNGNVKRVHTINTIARLTVVPLMVANRNCFGTFGPQQRNFETLCVELLPNGTLTKVSDEHSNLITNGVQGAVMLTQNTLLIYHDTEIGIYQYNNGDGWSLKVTFQMLRNVSDVTAVEHNGRQYIAGCSRGNQPSDSHGYIVVYRNDTGRFDLKQVIENIAAPARCQFTVTPSGELILYVITDNVQEQLITFKYRGVAGFERVATIDAQGIGGGDATSATENIRYLELFVYDADHRQFIAYNFGAYTRLVESVFV